MNAQPKYQPHRKPWNAELLLGQIDPSTVNLDPDTRDHLRTFLWYDLCAESDSANLYAELCARGPYSNAFNVFLDAWYADEKNHAQGFAMLHEILFGEHRRAAMSRARARPSDFSLLADFLDDEFKLSVLFAYDEFASVMTYEKDVFYRELGSPIFVDWIRRVRADEALHFGNLVKLLQTFHAHRFAEVPQTLRQILRIENDHHEYQGTFLFDHECPHFLVTASELNDQCANSVLRKILKDENVRLG